MFSTLKQWLDGRSGLISGTRRLGEAPVVGGPGWSKSLGRVLLALLALELVTGVAMGFYYSPSTTDAWASIAYLEHQVALGSFVRALHRWGMYAMVAVALLHLATTFVIGAYKKPREVTWLVGLITLLVLLGFGLTGIVLAWDAQGLAASRVETEIMRSMPLIGPLQREVLVGGNDYGNLSLTRFFALHAFVLPAVLIGSVWLHVALARRHGSAPRWWQTPEQRAAATVPYWPHQAVRDAVAALLVLGVVAALATAWPTPLYAPADPAGSFDARPEWYFMPLFELRKVFTGSGEIIATAVLPGLGLLFLAAVPFLDRGEALSPRRRARFVVPVLLGLGGAVALGVMGMLADRANEGHQEALQTAQKDADTALALATTGVPLDPLALHTNDPIGWGEQLFAEHCGSCHSLGTGLGSAPDLGGWGSQAWVGRFLDDPNHAHLYGRTESLACKMVGIEDYGIDDPDDRQALIDGLLANRGEHAPGNLPADAGARLAEVFDDNGCQACHSLETPDGEMLGKITSVGPDLTTWGSPDWFDELLLFPDRATHYGALNAMPSFAPVLDRAERDAIRTYVFAAVAEMPLSPEPTAEQQAQVICNGGGAAEDPGADADGDTGAEGTSETATPTTTAAASSAQALWQQGQQIFADKCSSCHTVGGADGNDVGPDLGGWGSRRWLLAFLADPDHAALYGGTDLEGNMPPAEDLGLEEAEELDLLAEAILARRGGQSPALEAAIAERAIEIFDDYSCNSCHALTVGELTSGAPDSSGPVLTGWGSTPWLHGLLDDPGAEAFYGDDNAMPPFADLSDDDLAALTHYMMSLADAPLASGLREAADELVPPPSPTPATP